MSGVDETRPSARPKPLRRGEGPRVALFVTCLVDLVRPSIGFVALKLLREAGCDVEAPLPQTCCGQPAWNSGASELAKPIARNVIAAFEDYDAVVAPSGSCAGMIHVHYEELFKDDPAWLPRAQKLAAKTYELCDYLVRIRGVKTTHASLPARCAYHDSCSALRELKIHDAPRLLLRSVKDLSLHELQQKEVCCGFGGLFSVKYSEISNRMAEEKTATIAATGAGTLAGSDLGCLLHLAGKLSRAGSNIKVRHIAEILAGDTQTPAIAEPPK